MYPLVFYYIFKYLFGKKWSLVLTFIITFTRFFEGYALSVITMLQHINAGDAEPLAIFLLLLSLLIFLQFMNDETKIKSKFYNFLFGFFLFLSVSLRPLIFITIKILNHHFLYYLAFCL